MLPIALAIFSPYTALIAVIYMTVRVFVNNNTISKNPWNTGLLMLFTWALFAGILNKNIYSASASIVILLYFFASVFIQNNFFDEHKIDRLMHSTLVLSLISAFIGIIEKVTAVYFHTVKWGYIFGMPAGNKGWNGYRIYSTFGNPNIAGDWFAIMIILCFHFYDSSSGRRKIFYLSCAYIFTSMLYLTGSRGAAVALLAGLSAYVLLRNRKSNFLLAASIFLLVSIFMFIVPQLLPILNKASSPMVHTVSRSLVTRQEIWNSSIKMFESKPITGWGILGILFSDTGVLRIAKEPHAHNIWLSLATTLGIVGLAIYFYMKKYLYEGLFFLLQQKCSLVPLLAALQVIFVVHGIVDFTIMVPQTGIIFIVCSSAICALCKQYSGAQDTGYSLQFPTGKKGLQYK